MNANIILLVVVLYFNLLSNHGSVAHGDDGDHHHQDNAHFDLSTVSHLNDEFDDDGHHHHTPDHYHGSGLRSSRRRPSLIDRRNRNESDASEYRRLLNSEIIETCGASNPTADEFKAASRAVTKWITNQVLNLRQVQTIEIDTYFHIILNGGVDEDTPTAEELESQIVVLNDSFRPHGFSFRLLGTTYTDNVDWYFAGSSSQEQTAMKAALRVGDASTLNIYLNRPTGSGRGTLLGYATFPFSYQLNPLNDGVVVHDEVVPGGLITRFQEGKTLAHEVGHWLGLFHTFQPDFGFLANINYVLYLLRLRNACIGAGDDVSDTPRSKSPNSRCPVGADTCRLRPGLDPINNFMEYTDDACRTEFTPGQSERMWAMWNEYRA